MTDLLLSLAMATLIRATALAGAVGLILTLFRMRASNTRHAAWATVLVVMLLMPVLTRVVPAIRVPVPEGATRSIAISPPQRIDAPLRQLPEPGTSRQAGTTASPVTAARLDLGRDVPMTPEAPIRWSTVVFAVYIAGLTLFLVRFMIGLSQLARIRRSSQPVVGLHGEPAWESALVAAPVTIGLMRPRVILPASWHEWSPDMLNAVLAHERAHCARRDPLIATLARLNTAIFWFHPLAWWLERTLATLAEHACDDAALAQVEPRRYAETLLNIAGTVRRHHGRLVWHGVGVYGDGRLGQRIDRVLNDTSRPQSSRTRRAIFATTCALAIIVAVACQQETRVEPLREDPELAAKMKANRDRNKEYWAARDMSLDQAAALEKALERNPDDEATRERLLNFYAWTGKNKQSWNDNVAARRRHALWLVEHHPDSPLVLRVAVTRETDPVGYADLRRRWLAITAPADADPKVLSNAAWFFALPFGHPSRPAGQQELQQAEALLLRARKSAIGTDAPSARRLVDLYVSALAPYSETAVDPALATWAKQRLDESSDARVLLWAGLSLNSRPQFRELGRSYVERASHLDGPAAQQARGWLRQINLFNGAPESEWPGIVAKSTGMLKLRQLAYMADTSYQKAEYSDWRARQPAGSKDASTDVAADTRLAAEGFAHARQYAGEVIELASSLTGAGVREAAFGAHHTYGLVLLHEGDRKGALKQMQEAANLPAPESGQPIGLWSSGLEYKLVFYLLKNGEREAVIDYFERASQGRAEARRKVMLASAAAIREGRMPEHYQYLFAGGVL